GGAGRRDRRLLDLRHGPRHRDRGVALGRARVRVAREGPRLRRYEGAGPERGAAGCDRGRDRDAGAGTAGSGSNPGAGRVRRRQTASRARRGNGGYPVTPLRIPLEHRRLESSRVLLVIVGLSLVAATSPLWLGLALMQGWWR